MWNEYNFAHNSSSFPNKFAIPSLTSLSAQSPLFKRKKKLHNHSSNKFISPKSNLINGFCKKKKKKLINGSCRTVGDGENDDLPFCSFGIGANILLFYGVSIFASDASQAHLSSSPSSGGDPVHPSQ